MGWSSRRSPYRRKRYWFSALLVLAMSVGLVLLVVVLLTRAGVLPVS